MSERECHGDKLTTVATMWCERHCRPMRICDNVATRDERIAELEAAFETESALVTELERKLGTARDVIAYSAAVGGCVCTCLGVTGPHRDRCWRHAYDHENRDHEFSCVHTLARQALAAIDAPAAEQGGTDGAEGGGS